MMRKKEIVTRIQSGALLHFEYGVRAGRRWFVETDEIEAQQAAKVIAELGMVSAGDCLFADAEPQSWRLP